MSTASTLFCFLWHATQTKCKMGFHGSMTIRVKLLISKIIKDNILKGFKFH